MRTLWIWIIILSVAGAVTSYLLIPSGQELAHIELKGRKYKNAEAFYQELYDLGDRSPDVMVELSRALENQGNLPLAIQIMKEYSDAHPDDLYGQRRLADLYQINHQYEEYYQTLQRIQQKTGKVDKELWQELADWHFETNQKPEQIKILQELVDSKQADGKDYLTLATLYAENHEYDKALSLLIIVKERFPKLVDINFLLLQAFVSEKKGDGKEALTDLADYLIKKQDPGQVYYAVGVIHEEMPEKTPLFIDLLNPLIKKDPRLESMALQTLWMDPENRKGVYSKLLEIISKRTKDPVLQNFAFEIFLEKKENDNLLDLMRHMFLKNIDDRNMVNFAIYAHETKDKALLDEMREGLGEEYLKTHPFTSLVLDIAEKKEGTEQLLEEFILNKDLTQTESYYLFKLASVARYDEQALLIGEKLPPYEGMAEYQLLDIAQGYIQMKKLDQLEKLIQETPNQEHLEVILQLLKITHHQPRAVAEWIHSQKDVKENVLSAFYQTAYDYKEFPLALYLAKRKLALYPSATSEADYAASLVQVGKISEGLAILSDLRQRYPQNKQIENDYFTSLLLGAKSSSYYHDELIQYMEQKEQKGPLSVGETRDFVYTYLDLLHDIHKAKRLLGQFVKTNSKATQEDIGTYIYLLGPDPDSQEIAWIQERAFSSSPKERSFWMQNLIFIGRFEEALALFELEDCESATLEAQFHYLETLAYLKLRPRLACAIDCVLNRDFCEFTLKEIEKLANFAEQASYHEARRWIYEQAVSRFPNNAILWQHLATASFAMRDYTRTQEALDTFFGMWDLDIENQGLSESLYQYGVVLDYQREFCRAAEYYEAALSVIESSPKMTIRMKEIAALSFYKLRNPHEALVWMRDLFYDTGRDPDMGASFANMLMDEGYLVDTSRLLRSLLLNRIGAFAETGCLNE